MRHDESMLNSQNEVKYPYWLGLSCKHNVVYLYIYIYIHRERERERETEREGAKRKHMKPRRENTISKDRAK
jgi:hypothetical protein